MGGEPFRVLGHALRKSELRIKKLEKLVASLILILDDKTRPENCYVNEWCVHDDWNKIKSKAIKLQKSKSEIGDL